MSILGKELTSRDSGLRRIIDPQGTLPDVAFKPNKRIGEKYDLSFGYAVLLGSREVGFAGLGQSFASDNYYFTRIGNTSGVKGVGMASYVLAAESAHEDENAFESGSTVSEDARKIWDVFISKGLAEIVKPFEFIEDPDHPYYKGRVVIPPVE